MTRTERARQRHERRVLAAAYLILLTVGIIVGAYAGARSGAADTIRHELVTPVTAAPTWAEPVMPAGDDERWQDPSGLPYCDPSSPLYPCLHVNPFSVDGGPEQQWQPVSQEFADALAEGDDTPPESATTRDWQACWAHVTEHTYTVVCPDGYVATA